MTHPLPAPPPSDPGPAGESPDGGPAGRPDRTQLYLIGAGLVIAFLLGWLISSSVGGSSSSDATTSAQATQAGAGSGAGSNSDSDSDESGQDNNDGSEPVIDPDLQATPDPADAVPKPPALPAGLIPDAPTPKFTCPPPTVTVSNANELYQALSDARPGDSIHLNDGIYQSDGEFIASAKGTDSQPIYLCGGKGAVLQGQGYKADYVLHFQDAAYWRVDGFTVRYGQKGVMVDTGTHLALQNLTVADIGDEAVHLRRNSTDNVVRGLTIYNTGNRRDKFGEGIYVGTAQSNWTSITGGQPDHSDGNFVLDNVISQTRGESVDIKEGTTGGVVAGNTFDGSALTGGDSWVDVKGNGWLIAGNRGRTSPKDGFQTHVVVQGWGNDNTFVHNVADVDGGSGVGYYLHEKLNNKIDCTNKVSGAAGGLSNDPCAD